MELDEVLRRRRMVRRFTAEPVPAADVDRLVAAALRTPSAGFTQGYHLLVLTAADDRARFWASTAYTPPTQAHAERAERLHAAPVLIVPTCSEEAYRRRYAQPDKLATEGDWSVPYWYVDAAFASMLVLLEAVDLGLGALFMGLAPGAPARLRDAFGVPADFEPIGVILVGHRPPDLAVGTRAERRRPAGEMVSVGRWGRPWAGPGS
jgi:nitroreductase